MGLKSSCESFPLLGVQQAPTFANVISVSGGGPLCLADGPSTYPVMQYQKPPGTEIFRPLGESPEPIHVAGEMCGQRCLQEEKFTWGWWCYCLQPALHDELLQPCILQL